MLNINPFTVNYNHFQDVTNYQQSSVKFEIMRHFIHTKSNKEKLACIKTQLMQMQTLVFLKINMSTLMAYMGKSTELQFCLDNCHPQLAGLNGKTLIDLARANSDHPSLNVLMNDLKTKKLDKIHHNDRLYLIMNYQPSFKEVVESCFKIPARF